MSRIAALIPARAGSQRIPGKNKKLLGGIPLVVHTIAQAKAAGIFDYIIVSTDDDEIRDLALQHGVAYASRMPEHATSKSPDIDWIADLLERPFGCPSLPLRDLVEAFAILRPTAPFRRVESILRAWQALQDNEEGADSIRAVAPAQNHPCKMWQIHGHLMQSNCECDQYHERLDPPHHSMPTQELDRFYAQTAGLEIAWIDRVLDQHSISGFYVMPYLMEWPESLDLNTQQDWDYATWLVESGRVALE